MNIESAFTAAFHGPAITDLPVLDHALDVLPMAIQHEDGTTVAEGEIEHRDASGAIERICYRLEVRHHRLVGKKCSIECVSNSSVLSRAVSPWLGSAEYLIALFAQRLAADPDFDRIEIAFPHTAEVE